MSCLFEIQIDPDTITVVVPEKGYSWKKPNLLAYLLPSRQLVAAFTTATEAEQVFQNSHPVNAELIIKPAFHPTDADSDIMLNALEYLVTITSETVKPWGFIGWESGLTAIDYNFRIADYELYSFEFRQKFEYALQAFWGAGQLTINRQGQAIARWKRNIERYFRTIMRFSSLGVLFGLPSLLRVIPEASKGQAVWLGLGFFLLVALLSEPLWALITRTWLPRDYLKFVIQSQRFYTTKSLTHWLLSK